MKSLPGSPGRWLPNTPAANFRGFSKTGKPYKGFGQRECRSQVQWKVHAHSGSCRKSCLWGRSSPRQLGESVWRGFWKQLPRQASNNWHHPDLYSGKVPTLKDGLTVQLRRLVGKRIIVVGWKFLEKIRWQFCRLRNPFVLPKKKKKPLQNTSVSGLTQRTCTSDMIKRFIIENGPTVGHCVCLGFWNWIVIFLKLT